MPLSLSLPLAEEPREESASDKNDSAEASALFSELPERPLDLEPLERPLEELSEPVVEQFLLRGAFDATIGRAP